MNATTITNASVEFETEIVNDKRQELISCYDKNRVCLGDFIPEAEIYEVRNPRFLADTFVFCKKHYDDIFLIGECEPICFITVNSYNQIEEIGSDFCDRFHFKPEEFDALLQRDDVKEASPVNKILFSMISDEFWAHGIDKRKYLK